MWKELLVFLELDVIESEQLSWFLIDGVLVFMSPVVFFEVDFLDILSWIKGKSIDNSILNEYV